MPRPRKRAPRVRPDSIQPPHGRAGRAREAISLLHIGDLVVTDEPAQHHEHDPSVDDIQQIHVDVNAITN